MPRINTVRRARASTIAVLSRPAAGVITEPIITPRCTRGK